MPDVAKRREDEGKDGTLIPQINLLPWHAPKQRQHHEGPALTTGNSRSTGQNHEGWLRSSHVHVGAEAVEVELTTDGARVRDSKESATGQPTLEVSPGAWKAFQQHLASDTEQ
jgi:hypothetical protein